MQTLNVSYPIEVSMHTIKWVLNLAGHSLGPGAVGCPLWKGGGNKMGGGGRTEARSAEFRSGELNMVAKSGWSIRIDGGSPYGVIIPTLPLSFRLNTGLIGKRLGVGVSLAASSLGRVIPNFGPASRGPSLTEGGGGAARF